MKLLWPALLVLLRTWYFLYSVWCLLFPVAALALLALLLQSQTLLGVDTRIWAQWLLLAFAGFGAVLLLLVYRRRNTSDPDVFQSAFLSWFGTLRFYWVSRAGDMVRLRLPSGFLVENPPAYRMGGRDMEQVLQLIQPGDILLRAYDGYLDGLLIRKSAATQMTQIQPYQPGWFTHAALYAGALSEADLSRVDTLVRHDERFFQQGPQMVVHAMAKGVHSESLLTFCRCDYLTVLRLLPCQGQVDVAATAQAARRSALEKIGKTYDFDSSDTRFNRFSCSELVYYCLQSVQQVLQLAPRPHALYPFSPWSWKLPLLTRTTIVPDDLYALVRKGSAAVVWEDRISADFHARQAAPAAPTASAGVAA